ncbi:hypothetical protein F5146DRAFT_1005218 [Armillaria mellea]|nr:hypothetical protein F5146DRAFT_1005218 [Armillaria mellea]
MNSPIRMAFVYKGPYERRTRKEECGGNIGRQMHKSTWSVMRTRDTRRRPPRWKAAIETALWHPPIYRDTVTALTTQRHIPHILQDTTGIKIIRPKEKPMTPQSTCYAQERPPALPQKVDAYLLRINTVTSPHHRADWTTGANPGPRPLGIATDEVIVLTFAGIGRVKRRDSWQSRSLNAAILVLRHKVYDRTVYDQDTSILSDHAAQTDLPTQALLFRTSLLLSRSLASRGQNLTNDLALRGPEYWMYHRFAAFVRSVLPDRTPPGEANIGPLEV